MQFLFNSIYLRHESIKKHPKNAYMWPFLANFGNHFNLTIGLLRRFRYFTIGKPLESQSLTQIKQKTISSIRIIRGSCRPLPDLTKFQISNLKFQIT